MIEQIFLLYRKIEIAKRYQPKLNEYSDLLNFLLGMNTDILFAQSPSSLKYLNLASFVNNGNQDFFLTDRWRHYLKKRFPTIEPQIFHYLWKEMEKAMDDFFIDKLINRLS